MKLQLSLFPALLLLMTTVIVTAGVTWYSVDRVGMLKTACEAGLPNFSRPASLDADEVGCAILGERRRYVGNYLTFFEVSSFRSDGFDPLPGELGQSQLNSWFNCPEGGCGQEFSDQLDRNYFDDDADPFFQRGMAYLVVEGWVTIDQGQYGHLGLYPREFFADRIIAVREPPQELIDEYLLRDRFSDFLFASEQ